MDKLFFYQYMYASEMRTDFNNRADDRVGRCGETIQVGRPENKHHLATKLAIFKVGIPQSTAAATSYYQ